MTHSAHPAGDSEPETTADKPLSRRLDVGRCGVPAEANASNFSALLLCLRRGTLEPNLEDGNSMAEHRPSMRANHRQKGSRPDSTIVAVPISEVDGRTELLR